ncbi:MAG: GNAT family N-acetyltransferase [Clostridia bacterium]|nr:GNAT family N-acetyltransferase [Clostridia bacterium]
MRTMPVLETRRMLLRPAAPALARAALAFYRRNAQRLQAVEPLYDPAFLTLSAQRRMQRADRAAARRGEGVRFWMFRKDEPDTAIGCVALNNIVFGAFRSCFIAYKTDGALLRQGYGSEAVNAVVDFAFHGLGLHRVEASVMPRNQASLALARACGFREEGRSPAYLQINGVWEEHIHMVKRNEAEERQSEDK